MGLWERIERGDCVVVAEVAQAHDGSLGTAHSYVDIAADCGADAVKFQVHIAAEESTLDEPWRVKFSLQDESRYDYWRRMEFTEEQWQGLSDHALERGIAFVASPFSVAAVKLLHGIGQPFFKIASGELYNPELIEATLATGRPLVISTGMATYLDIDSVVERCRGAGAAFALLQCTSAYPAPPETWGLGLIGELERRYECPVGFSDHSGTVSAGIAAATLGARIIEVHVAMSRAGFGPDVTASLEPSELAVLTHGIRDIAVSRASSPDKEALAVGTAGLRDVFGRSWAPARPLPAGYVIERTDLVLKKPGTGIAVDDLGAVLGRALARDVVPEHLLEWEDLA